MSKESNSVAVPPLTVISPCALANVARTVLSLTVFVLLIALFKSVTSIAVPVILNPLAATLSKEVPVN